MGKLKPMELGSWLEMTGRKPAAFARELGVKASTVHRIVRQTRKPSYQLMQKIAVATDGAVRPDDFFPDLPSDTPPVLAPEEAA